jgi:hypothetical protein
MKSLVGDENTVLKSEVELELRDYQSNTVYNLNLSVLPPLSPPDLTLMVYDISNLDSLAYLQSVQVPH